jgi:protein O-GlcNAc transferase
MSELLSKAQQLFQSQRYRECVSLLQELHEQDPSNGLYATNLCFTLRIVKQVSEAISWGELSIRLDSQSALAYLNLGMAYLVDRQLDNAETMFKKGLELDPKNGFLWNGLGMRSSLLSLPSQAIKSYEKARQLDPVNPEILSNLANAQLETLDISGAFNTLQTALQTPTGHQMAATNLAMIQQYVPELSSGDVQQLLNLLGKIFATRDYQFVSKQLGKAGVARIGFVSSDFYQHTVGRLLVGLFRQTRPKGLEFYCYSNCVHTDGITEQFESLADAFYPITQKSDAEAAELIYSHSIDLLIDLNGHTSDSRIAIFCLRPAKVQASWLGFFASTGVPAIDYSLIGRDQILPGIEEHYSEKIQPLNCCQYNGEGIPQVALAETLPSERQQYITFACFNNPAKLNHKVLHLWVSLLKRIPDSRLVLKWQTFGDAEFVQSLRNKFAELGLADDRLILRPRSDYLDMLQEYNDIDIVLDPFPFSGAMTTVYALWMGVPVISLAGFRPVSRQSSAILESLNLRELVASTEAEYKELAISLAEDTEQRIKLRKSLRQTMETISHQQNKVLLNELQNLAEKGAKESSVV